MAILDVIKYEGDNQTFVWKHPAEDFNTSSLLIVHESQEAHLFLGGQALDAFGPGRHTLTTQNVPVLTSVANLATGGVTPFHAEVYFVNLVEQMGIAWGTASKVQYMDPEYGFPLSIGASGEMALAVRDGRRLLLKVVGTEAALSQAKLIGYLKAFLQTRIKATLATAIVEQRLGIFEMDAHLEELSGAIKARLVSDFEEYGLELTQFLVTTIVRPEGDPSYERFRELFFRQYADVREAQIEQQAAVINAQTEAQRTVIASQAAAQRRSIEGYTYQQERSFDVATKVAENEAIGQFANLGVGLGAMAGVGASVGGMVAGAVGEAAALVAPVTPAATGGAPPAETLPKFCPQCGRPFAETDKFCPECGTRRG